MDTGTERPPDLRRIIGEIALEPGNFSDVELSGSKINDLPSPSQGIFLYINCLFSRLNSMKANQEFMMNRIVKAFFPLLIFSLLLAYTGPLMAQGYRVAASSAQASGIPGDWVQVKIELANISGKDLNLRVEITDRSGLPSDWNTQICFFQNCFPPGSSSHEGTMEIDFKEDIDITFITGANPGTGTVKVLVTNLDNTSEKSELTFTAVTGTSAISGIPAASDLILSQNYPNPFAMSKYNGTTITYRMSEPGSATLKVYNLLGKEVRSLVNEMRPFGKSSITWDGRDNTGRQVPAGIYVYKLTTNSQTLSRRMMITR